MPSGFSTRQTNSKFTWLLYNPHFPHLIDGMRLIYGLYRYSNPHLNYHLRPTQPPPHQPLGLHFWALSAMTFAYYRMWK